MEAADAGANRFFSFDPDSGGSDGRNSGGAILSGAELSPTANGIVDAA